MSYFIQKAQSGTDLLNDNAENNANSQLNTSNVNPNDEVYGNIIDLAEIGRGAGLFGRRRDSKILAKTGFKYFDVNDGTFKVENDKSAKEIRKLAKEAARREDLERRYGLLSDTSKWSDEAIKYRQNEVKTDNRYFTRNNNSNSVTPNPSEKRTYRYGFTNDNTGFGNAAILYLNELYNDKNYDGLNTILGNGTIFNSNNFGNFLSSKWNSGTNSFNDDFLGTLTDDQVRIFGNYMKTRPVPGTYDLSTSDGVKKFQQDNNIKVDGLIGPQTRNAINNWNTQNPNLKIDIDNNWSTIYRPAVRNSSTVLSTESNTSNAENESSNVDNSSVFLGNTPRKSGLYLGGTPVSSTIPSRLYSGTSFPRLYFNKQGGQMKYFQTGGAINQQQVAQEQAQSQQAQLNEIFQAIALNPKETLAALQQQGIQPKQIIDLAKKMAEQKNPAAIEALNALQQMSLMAKQGAKLAYVKKLRGECPDGMEMHYYKVGGVMCKKCMQKIEAEKCGGKTKKKKCGGEIKKNSKGGECSTVSEFKNKRNCK